MRLPTRPDPGRRHDRGRRDALLVHGQRASPRGRALRGVGRERRRRALVAGQVDADRRLAAPDLRRHLDRVDDAAVAGAAAEVAGDGELDLVARWAAGSDRGAPSRSSACPACRSRTARRRTRSKQSTSGSRCGAPRERLDRPHVAAVGVEREREAREHRARRRAITVHAPQSPLSQPCFVPMRSRS